MNDEFVNSVDFIGNLIDLDLIWDVQRIFGKNCQSYQDYQSDIIKLSMAGSIEPTEAQYRLYDHICQCIGDYTPIPTLEFSAILAPLRAEQFESDEAYDALLQPLEDWIERLSRLPVGEVA